MSKVFFSPLKNILILELKLIINQAAFIKLKNSKFYVSNKMKNLAFTG